MQILISIIILLTNMSFIWNKKNVIFSCAYYLFKTENVDVQINIFPLLPAFIEKLNIKDTWLQNVSSGYM